MGTKPNVGKNHHAPSPGVGLKPCKECRRYIFSGWPVLTGAREGEGPFKRITGSNQEVPAGTMCCRSHGPVFESPLLAAFDSQGGRHSPGTLALSLLMGRSSLSPNPKGAVTMRHVLAHFLYTEGHMF